MSEVLHTSSSRRAVGDGCAAASAGGRCLRPRIGPLIRRAFVVVAGTIGTPITLEKCSVAINRVVLEWPVTSRLKKPECVVAN